MADVGKVPGTRSRPEVKDEEVVAELSGDALVNALNEEVAIWNRLGLHAGAVEHDVFALDVQLMTVVNVLIDLEIINIEDFNDRYRRRFLMKLQNLRSNITKAQITQGVVPPNSGIVIAR
jgi:hypothetical protein